MSVRDLADVRDLFGSVAGSICGVGITAYSRIIPASFRHPYYIIALRKTKDLPLLRKAVEIFCLEEEMGRSVETEDFNSADLLSNTSVKEFLRKRPEPRYLLLYQSYARLEALARREGWMLLANPSSLRRRVAGRAFFHKMAADLQLNRLPGGIYPLHDLYARDYDYWASHTGPSFVVQFPEIGTGGGKGTFFIKSAPDYHGLRQTVGGGTWRGVKLERVAIRKFMDGTPASLALCLTRYGILYSGLQRQLIDLPYCKDLPEDGIFCGHSWGETVWASHIRQKTLHQARLIGEHLAGLGYRGILGIDFLITDDEAQVYPLECNPRFTGAFPMLSQLYIARGIIPMDVFHILEFLNVPYQIDTVSLNAQYAEAIRGSHVILFARSGLSLKGDKVPEAGLYELDPDTSRPQHLGEAGDYVAMYNDRQFILIDGPPALPEGKRWGAGRPRKADAGMAAPREPLKRLCRILFPFPILNGQKTLPASVQLAVDWVYERVFP